MADDKIWCGRGKKFTFAKGGYKIRLSVSQRDIDTMTRHLNNGWVNIDLYETRQPDAKGNTHTMSIDTWKPNGEYKKPTEHDSHSEAKSNGYQPQDRPQSNHPPMPPMQNSNSVDDDPNSIPF